MKATIHYKSGMTLEVELGDGGLQVRGGESKSAGPLRSIRAGPGGAGGMDSAIGSTRHRAR